MKDKNLKSPFIAPQSSNIHHDFFDHTKQLGQLLSDLDCMVTYGGGATGLMGALADSMLKNGGKIRGLIPEFMVEKEWQHPDIHDAKVVCTMHERKEQMLQDCDIAMFTRRMRNFGRIHGGLDLEATRTFPWSLLLILNTRNYYDSLA